MEVEKYQCMFCGETIPLENGICAVLLIANWNGPDATQYEQQLFAHTKCLRDNVHKSVPLYVLDLK